MVFGRRKHISPPEVVPPQETDGILAARKLKERSRNGLLDAVDSGIETREVVERVSEIHRANHFGPDIERAMRTWRGQT